MHVETGANRVSALPIRNHVKFSCRLALSRSFFSCAFGSRIKQFSALWECRAVCESLHNDSKVHKQKWVWGIWEIVGWENLATFSWEHDETSEKFLQTCGSRSLCRPGKIPVIVGQTQLFWHLGRNLWSTCPFGRRSQILMLENLPNETSVSGERQAALFCRQDAKTGVPVCLGSQSTNDCWNVDPTDVSCDLTNRLRDRLIRTRCERKFTARTPVGDKASTIHCMWSDLWTTHLVLTVGDPPHEPVEISVAGHPQIEVLYHGSDDPGVRLGQPLGVGFNSDLPCDVLTQETQQIYLLWSDRLRRASNIGHHDSQREHRTTRGHVTSPWGGGRNAG